MDLVLMLLASTFILALALVFLLVLSFIKQPKTPLNYELNEDLYTLKSQIQDTPVKKSKSSSDSYYP